MSMTREEIKARFCRPGAYNCVFQSGWELQFNPLTAEELADLCEFSEEEDGKVTYMDVYYLVAKCGRRYIILKQGETYIPAANPGWDTQDCDMSEAMRLFDEDYDSVSENGLEIYGHFKSLEEAENAVPSRLKKEG